MSAIEVHTQAQLDKALRSLKPGDWIVCRGGTMDNPLRAFDSATVWASGSAVVRAFDSAVVRASDSATVWASGSAVVEASGSAVVRAFDSAVVRASGSAVVRASDSATVWASGSAVVEASGSAAVEAFDSAVVRASGSAVVRASDSATVRAYGSATVEAFDSATVRAYGSATVRASKLVAVHRHGDTQKITGGTVIQVPTLYRGKTEDWLDYHGLTPKRGIVTLFKAVTDGWAAGYNGFKYEPGSKPEAPDWNPKPVCGGGLHMCARPWQAKSLYHREATRFVACPVRVSEIVVIDEQKVKVPRVVRPVYEVDEDGEAVASMGTGGKE